MCFSIFFQCSGGIPLLLLDNFSVLFKMLLREEASFIEVTLLTKTYSLDYEFVEKRVKPGNQFSMRYGEC